jgi:hypothetical protein
VCRLLLSGRAVVLAIGYPRDEQHLIDELLHARALSSQRALLASPFWSRPTEDGRSSRAMLNLLDWVRQQVTRGTRVRIVAFDSLPQPAGTPGGAAAFDARDEAMAVGAR